MYISKQFEVHHSTVKKFIHQWKSLKTDNNIHRDGILENSPQDQVIAVSSHEFISDIFKYFVLSFKNRQTRVK